MTSKKVSVGILGGGISGLSIAYALRKKGIDVDVYEKNRLPGGLIQSKREGEWLVEQGPNTLLVRSEKVWNLLDELNLRERVREANPEAKKRYILKNNALCPVPLSAGQFFSTDLLSATAKFRLFKELFVRAPAQNDESIAGFISRRLGREPLDYAVNPFVSGVYAGDPKRLSVKHTFSTLFELEQQYGSLIKGAFKRPKKKSSVKRTLLSFDEGLQVLPYTLKKSLGSRVHLNCEVQAVSKTEDDWNVRLLTPDGEEQRNHHAIVTTLPLHVIEHLFSAERLPGLSPAVQNIPYVPLSVIGLGYKEVQVSHPLNGFGVLIPEVESLNILGTLFSSTLFPGRAPAGHALLTSFVGGARQPELAKHPKEALFERVQEDLNKLLGITGEPVFTYHKFWKHAIPQYEVGFDSCLERMEVLETQNPGLFMAGNFRDGVSVPDRITSGFETAERVDLFLES